MKLFIPNFILISILLIFNNIEINCKPAPYSVVYDTLSEKYDYNLYRKNIKEKIALKKEKYLDIFSNSTIENDIENIENKNNTFLFKKSNTKLQLINFINYEESLSEVDNPYRGFFKHILVSLKLGGKHIKDNLPSTGLVRLIVDISEFQREELTEDAIDYLKNIFQLIKSNHQTVVIRFSYHKRNSSKNKSTEPELGLVIKHLDQLQDIFKIYEDAIASVECGLFGRYGEMYESDIKEIQNIKMEFINEIIKKWLTILPNSITLSVRTPEHYTNYTGVIRSKISQDQPTSNQEGYRIGIYNDAYFASKNDIGTYSNRKEDIKWLMNQSTHTLYGGEFGNFLGQDMGDITINALEISKEAYQTHTSYLNSEYYEGSIEILSKRKCSDDFGIYSGQTELRYLENHLGYRFVVRRVSLTKEVQKNGIFSMEVEIENVGFANLIKPKIVYVFLTNNNNLSYTLSSIINTDHDDPCQWWSNEKVVYKVEGTLPSNMPNDNYKVYIRIASNGGGGLNGYPIRFANDDENIWNEFLGANYLGDFLVVGSIDPPKIEITDPDEFDDISSNDNDNTNTSYSNKYHSLMELLQPFSSMYTIVKFKGMLKNTSNYYLGVPELKEYDHFNTYELKDTESAKYHTWHVDSEINPSFLYLSNGIYGHVGEPTEYCLDLSTYVNAGGYNYLSIVKCVNAKHKFLYGKSYSNSVDIYDVNGVHLTDNKGNNVCLYYSITPRIDKCNISSSKRNMSWMIYHLYPGYTPVKFRGMLENQYNQYLGVSELKEYNGFDIGEANSLTYTKYHTWHVVEESVPSLLYLSNGINGNNGEPTNYCLDLGTYVNREGYNYLSIVDCSKAKHKFMFGDSFSSSIDIYKKNGDHLTDKNGYPVCLYYSMTPRIDKCHPSKNIKNIYWNKFTLVTTYTPIRFKGTLYSTQNYYLGVKELKEYDRFNIFELNVDLNPKYRTWHILSENSPSLLYLSDGESDRVGKPTEYCLDLGTNVSDKGYSYLSVVRCSKAQHKFMYDGSASKSISVYTRDGNRITNKKGVNLCLYYSMTPRVDECNLNIKNIIWDKY
jgi:hypothetical protein